MARTSFGDNNSDGKDWKPSVDAEGVPRREADPEKDFIEGYFIRKKEDVGKNKSNVYEIRIHPDPNVKKYTGFGEPGELITVWGSKSSGSNNVLDKQMGEFINSPIGGPGAWCRIEFNGRKVKKDAQDKKESLLQPNDLVILYTVIGDDEIPRLEVAAAPVYKAAPSNAAPVKKEEPATPAAPVKEVPASIEEDDDDLPDDLPF